MSNTPPGWYQSSDTELRWWDGTQWTNQVQPTSAYPPAPFEPSPPLDAQRRSPARWLIPAAIGIVVLIVAVVALVVLLPKGGIGPNSSPAATVEAINDIWHARDCEAFNEITTANFRDEFGVSTCELFDEAVTYFKEDITDYSEKITSVDIDGDTATVITRESFTTIADDESYSNDVTYGLIRDASGRWILDTVRYDEL